MSNPNIMKIGARTSVLWERLFKSPSADQYMRDNDGELALPAFPQYITALCKKRGEAPERAIKRGGIERSFGHQIFRGDRNPSRDTVLQLAFGLELNIDETQELLKIARMSALHPKVRRDAAIAYCLHHGVDFVKTQLVLHELELPLLGDGKR